MPRPRTNDPLGVCDKPRQTDAPVVTERISAEFQHRLAYVLEYFSFARMMESKTGTVEASLVRLRKVLAHKRPTKPGGTRLHPEVEMLLSHQARRYAAERTGQPDAPIAQCDVLKAARYVIAKVKVKQGAPADHIQRHTVEALMALAQEVTGEPVMARRTRNSLYEPHLADPKAQMIYELLRSIDPHITATKLVNIICQARRKYAGKPMRFDDLMPCYAGKIEQFVPNLPIYCP